MIEKLNLNEEELNSNFEEFLSLLNNTFTGTRLKGLLNLYKEDCLGLSACTAPASTNEHFHLAIPGGYLMHIMHVVKYSFGVKSLIEMGGGVVDFTDEEMVFAAIHHDLGKLGDPDMGDYYVVEDQDWKRRRGDMYSLNPNIQYMDATDRAIYILQKYKIPMTWKEFLAIKLSDGLFSDANAKYYKTYNRDFFLKTKLPLTIHIADWMSCNIERDIKDKFNMNDLIK